MKVIFKRLPFVLLVVLLVSVWTSVSVGAADAACTGDSHAWQYTVANGTLQCTCACGATELEAEQNAEGGPVVYIGTCADAGQANGDGMTAMSAIETPAALANLLGSYKAGGAPKPVTVVVVGVFSADAAFSIDAGNQVTFTSVWDGTDYASEENGYARLYLNANVHCYNDIVFDRVTFAHPKAARCIGMNGYDLTATNVQYYSGGKMITSIKSTAMYAILSGDLLDATHTGSDLADLDQTITVDSGMWICIDVGCYRSITSSAFLDMSGKVTVNISGDAQVINRASGAPWKYRGLSAAGQILSADGLDVVYNISGGTFVLNEGLNVVGRDSQAPAEGSVRNIAATYNITGGDFGDCAVYATVRPALTNSIPTVGKVVFNVTEGVNLGAYDIDTEKDAYRVIPKEPATEEKTELAASATAAIYSDGTATLRVTATPTIASGATVECHGVFFAPAKYADSYTVNGQFVKKDGAPADGERFSADLVGIPENAYDVDIYVWAFVKLEGVSDLVVCPVGPVSVRKLVK